MDIKARIVSRKVVFNYFYQKYFVEYLSEKDIFFDDILKVDKLINWKEPTKEDKKEIISQIRNFYNVNEYEEDIDYIVYNFFDNIPAEELDFEYIKNIISGYNYFKNELEESVDSYVETFKMKEMDIVDRSIFLLGYLEKKQIDSPRKLVINEMIELAKRYGDEGSYSLINGILHKII